MSEKQLSAREARAKDFLERFNLMVEKIPEASTKTPDFQVTTADGFQFLVEVKAVKGPGEDQDITFQALHNGLSSDICSAAKQFDAYGRSNSQPNVLVMLSEDPRIHVQTLYDLLSGQILVEGELMLDLKRQRLGKMDAALVKIDLIILISTAEVPSYFFTGLRPPFFTLLVRFFGQSDHPIP